MSGTRVDLGGGPQDSLRPPVTGEDGRAGVRAA
jgi:hypothetical protein